MRLRALSPLLLLAACSACATISHGRYQTVAVDSDPAGAAVRIVCAGVSQPGGTTPTVVKLHRKSDTCALTLTRTGYEDKTVDLRRVRSGAFWGNVGWGIYGGAEASEGSRNDFESSRNAAAALGFIGGTGVGMLIDYATGGMYALEPAAVNVKLTPRE